MPTLPLAVAIADAVSNAQRRRLPLDVEAKTNHLLDAYPGADATRSDIADTLRAESAAAGILALAEQD
ncbi:hypothetical protein [Mesorhizobium sp. WSM2239]|uniref:Uncharacterized protein n=2 Tax=unclassified Mesorhizobium TaxID=325217 RepID=A0AAU8DDP0_9HYPH